MSTLHRLVWWSLATVSALVVAVGAGGAQAAGGQLDPSFGSGSDVLTDFGSADQAFAVAAGLVVSLGGGGAGTRPALVGG